MADVRDLAADKLSAPSTARIRPGFEGNNISHALGFKHINYVSEAAVLHHFREAGLPVGRLYKEFGLGFEIVELKSRLVELLDLDDEVTAEVVPVTKPGATELSFKVSQFVERDGRSVKSATSTVKVVLRIDEHVPASGPYPEEVGPFAVRRLGTGARLELGVTPRPYGSLNEGRGTVGADPVLARLIGEDNAFGWRWRVPYFYCHFNERLQMSGFLRVMEEAEDLFLAERGLPIKHVLDTRRWIPVVTQSEIRLLDETLMEEELHTVYTIEDVFKELLYTARMDTYVIRGGELVHTATGRITHGYLHEYEPNSWRMATLDEATVAALSTPKKVHA
ncbi:thioesterase family protein [Kitasatospora sp. A2-31]|uniref:thioesterase family protein n=1 Tax=Kitasatospora sp. A2-31 TaxID=2916414 RepID=UPI001EEB50FA|nr:thioesterase family protein [Kitasatospora sp. A2-31]MCG6495254.1 thioesterase family protein [Kitasatospora sp. A2-31]